MLKKLKSLITQCGANFVVTSKSQSSYTISKSRLCLIKLSLSCSTGRSSYKLIIIALGLILANQCFASQERELLSPDVALSMHSSIINPITPHLVFANKEIANAWLNDMSNRLKKWIPDEFIRRRLLTVIQYESKRAGLDTQLILGLITIESKFDKYAISNSGAQGLMQVMPFWLTQIGVKGQDLFDTETNIRYGCTILRYYLIKEHGDMRRALARYNGSLGHDTYPNLVYGAYNTYWQPSTIITIKNKKINYIDYFAN